MIWDMLSGIHKSRIGVEGTLRKARKNIFGQAETKTSEVSSVIVKYAIF